MKNGIYGIITEAARAESFEVDDINLNMEISEIERVIESIDELDTEIMYTVEMVNVIGDTDANGNEVYMVELENVQKYMESCDIDDYAVAILNIAEANSLDCSAMCLVIESEDAIMLALNEAKKAKKVTPGKMKRIKNTADVLKLIKTKGIKVAKRKSKSSRKKRKS